MNEAQSLLFGRTLFHHIQWREKRKTNVTTCDLYFLLVLSTSVFPLVPTQKAFHADVVSVMRKWLKEEDFLPEDHRQTSRARDHYVKVIFLPPSIVQSL